jgi:hypothetical protein
MRRLVVSLVCLACLAVGCSPSTIDSRNIPGRGPVPVAIWSTRDLPAGLDRRLAQVAGVRFVSRVSVGMLNLVAVTGATNRLPPRARGAVLPISINAMDPVPGDPAAAALTAGDAVLSEPAAQLRGMSRGSTITVSSRNVVRTFRVGTVVPETSTHGAELTVPIVYARVLRLTATRGLITSIEHSHADDALREIDALTAGARVRVRTGIDPPEDPSEGPVLAFAEVKRIFGEFTFTPSRGLFVTVDKAWTDANIVKVRLPLLGLITCNERLLPQLRGAMQELQAEGLGALVRSYDGCFSPRMTVGNTYALSRHAFGIAVDINAGRNRFGDPPHQDPRLVAVMERWGFSWGGNWLVPDGMHFEFVRFVTQPTPS